MPKKKHMQVIAMGQTSTENLIATVGFFSGWVLLEKFHHHSRLSQLLQASSAVQATLYNAASFKLLGRILLLNIF